MIIYIAGKYTGDIEKNTKEAAYAAVDLFKLGVTPIIPHTMYNGIDKYGIARNNIMRAAFELIEASDGVLLLSNWADSPGAKEEKKYAEKMGIPIYYGIDAIIQYLNE